MTDTINESNAFNKLQYSKFVGNDQFVVRSNNTVEFLELVAFIDDFVAKLPAETKFVAKYPQNSPNKALETQMPVPTNLGNCPKCGSPNKLSMKGKIYCGRRCWLETVKEY